MGHATVRWARSLLNWRSLRWKIAALTAVACCAVALAGIFPHGTSIVLPGAHFPWVTAPDAFAEAVGRFLDG